MSITVFLSKAIICFASVCHPVLVGKDTPVGEFQLIKRHVVSAGYGGTVLQFDETDTAVYSVHRVWLGNPKQRRLERLHSDKVEDRITITNGCINVMPDVYDLLEVKFSGEKIRIVK